MQAFTIAEHKMFQVDGREFLYLGADNALFEMDSRTKEILKPWALQKKFSKDEFFAGLNNPDDDKEEVFTGLLQRHVIRPVNQEMDRRIEIGSVSIPLKTIVLHLTEACNLSCTYCYHRQKEVPRPKNGWMTLPVAQRAVDFLFEHSGNLPEVVVVFFGGEPLLNFELLSSVVSYARGKATEQGKKVEFALTTNGTLLTQEIIRFLYEHRIGVTVSIDGYEGVPDRYRCFPDGSPSYHLVVSKVKGLLQGLQNKPVVARVTVVRNPNDLPQLFDHLVDLGFTEVGFGPVTTNDPLYQLDSKGMNLLLEQFKGLSQRFLNAAQKGEFFGFSNLIDLLVGLHEGERKHYPCGAGLGLFSVDHQGRLYLCQRFTGENEFCMGDIFKGFDQTRLESFRNATEVHQRGNCFTCWVSNICAGGCYHEAWVRQENPVKPNVHYCEWIQKWVEIGLEVYSHLALTCPEYLDKLSGLRGHVPTTRN